MQAARSDTVDDSATTANGGVHLSDDVATSSRSSGDGPGVDPTEEEALDMSVVHLASVLSADLEDMPKGELTGEHSVHNLRWQIRGQMCEWPLHLPVTLRMGLCNWQMSLSLLDVQRNGKPEAGARCAIGKSCHAAAFFPS